LGKILWMLDFALDARTKIRGGILASSAPLG
jgi:hypothetical protein